jgi:hypothetical protein
VQNVYLTKCIAEFTIFSTCHASVEARDQDLITRNLSNVNRTIVIVARKGLHVPSYVGALLIAAKTSCPHSPRSSTNQTQ